VKTLTVQLAESIEMRWSYSCFNPDSSQTGISQLEGGRTTFSVGATVLFVKVLSFVLENSFVKSIIFEYEPKIFWLYGQHTLRYKWEAVDTSKEPNGIVFLKDILVNK
jgi:hypothetical protein